MEIQGILPGKCWKFPIHQGQSPACNGWDNTCQQRARPVSAPEGSSLWWYDDIGMNGMGNISNIIKHNYILYIYNFILNNRYPPKQWQPNRGHAEAVLHLSGGLRNRFFSRNNWGIESNTSSSPSLSKLWSLLRGQWVILHLYFVIFPPPLGCWDQPWFLGGFVQVIGTPRREKLAEFMPAGMIQNKMMKRLWA
jgi:hypothetical protein